MAEFDLNSIPYLEARHHGGARTDTRFLVIHSMESGEFSNTAENFASWIHTTDKVVSIHYGVDNDSTVCTVQPGTIAWHASGGNTDTVGTEHAGRADQTRTQWLDTYGMSMLRRSAKLQAALCHKYGIEPRRATATDYVNSQLGGAYRTGILGHIDITLAAQSLGRSNHGHWDPGPHFPWDIFIGLVKAAYDEQEEAVMGVTKEELKAMISKAIDARMDAFEAALPELLDQAERRNRKLIAAGFEKENLMQAMVEAARLGTIKASE